MSEDLKLGSAVRILVDVFIEEEKVIVDIGNTRIELNKENALWLGQKIIFMAGKL